MGRDDAGHESADGGETVKRSLIPVPGYRHPSASAWQAGCGCEPCKTYRRRKSKLRKMYGSSKVPAGPARAWVEQLVAEGYSRQAIAAAANVADRTISSTTLAKRVVMDRRVSAALLNLTRHDIATNSLPVSLIPAIGAARRLQALMWMGWRMVDLAANRTEYHMINAVRTGPDKRIMASNWLRIAEMYDRHAMTPGPHKGNRTKAIRRGYAPPLAWDDIDDPHAAPIIDPPTEHDLRMEMYRQGASDRTIAHEFGVSSDSVRTWRRRHGLPAQTYVPVPLGDEGDDRYALWQQGMTDTQITEAMGLSKDVIRRWRIKNGLEPRRRAG